MPYIVWLELGEQNPSIETLERLARVLGLRFVLDVAPPGGEPLTLPSGVRVIQDVTTAEGGRVLVAAG